MHPDELARYLRLDRQPAGAEAARWVENHWSLWWDLPRGQHYNSRVLAHPTCALTVERGSHPRTGLPPGETLVVTGVATRRFDVDLAGWGRVVGVRFRPGGLTALTGRSASAWTDRVIAASDVFPRELCTTLADPELADVPAEWAAAAERSLGTMACGDDSRYDEFLGIVADMLAERALVTVAQVAERHGTTPRTLQRLFRHYVGIGPKWVLARYRMHDIVSDLDHGYAGTITDLAHRYGWYDQAHLNREFTTLVRMTPGDYRASRDRPRATVSRSARAR